MTQPFLEKLRLMVDNTEDQNIKWSAAGDLLVVEDVCVGGQGVRANIYQNGGEGG